MGISVGEVEATLSLKDNISGQAAQAAAAFATQMGTIKASATAAAAEVSSLTKAWQEATTDADRNALAQQLGEAMIGAQALDAQLVNTKKDLNNLLNPPEENKGALSKFFEELKPSADEANSAFGSLKNTITETFENPIGMVKQFGSALMEDVAGGLGAVGVAAVATLGAVMAIGAAMFELAENAASVGGKLNDVGEKTGMSVPALSHLSQAAQVAGSDIDKMSNALFMFEQRMGDNTKKFQEGMEKIGVSVEQLEQGGVDNYLNVIAEGLSNIEDPSQRASAAMDLMGRQGREMIPVLLKLAEAQGMVADIQPWTDQEAKDAEQFEMQISDMKVHAEALAIALGRELLPAVTAVLGILKDWVPFLVDVTLKISGLKEMFRIVTTEIEYGKTVWSMLRGEVEKLPEPVGATTRSIKAANDAAKEFSEHGSAALTMSLGDIKAAEKDLDTQIKEKIKTNKEALKLAIDYASNLDGYRATVDALSGAVVEGIKYDLARGVSQKALADVYGLTEQQIKAIISVQKDELAIEKDLATNRTQVAKEVQKYYSDQAKAQASALKVEQDAFLSNMGTERTMISQHADFVAKTTMTTYDYQRHLIDDWTNNEEGKLNYSQDNWKASYDAIQQTARDKMQAVAQAELAALDQMKAQESNWSNGLQKVFGNFPELVIKGLTGGGGMGGVGSALVSSLGALGGEQLITKPLTSLFNSAAPKLLDSFGSTLTTAIGGAIPFIGPAIGALAPALINGIKSLFGGVSQAELDGRKLEAAFEQQFGGFQKMMDAVGGAYEATGKSAAQAQADVKALLDAEKNGTAATQSMIDTINSAFNDQKQDAADLNAAIQKYGFSIEQLGPAMQRQQLDDQAKSLLNDWRLLVASGIDVVTVDQKMADSTWNYLQMAKKTGQEVPEAMKPVIQSMLDQGVFTDANGDKITDMTKLGLTFSETMTQGFDKVVNKLQELLEKIGMVPAALTAASGPLNVDVNLNAHWNAPETPDWGGPQAAGGDYFVTKPTLFLAGEAGPEHASFGGANGSRMSGSDTSQALDRLASLMSGLPMSIARAVRDASLLAG